MGSDTLVYMEELGLGVRVTWSDWNGRLARALWRRTWMHRWIQPRKLQETHFLERPSLAKKDELCVSGSRGLAWLRHHDPRPDTQGPGEAGSFLLCAEGPGTQAWTFLICASTRTLLLCWITWNVEEQEPKERAEAVSGVQMGGGWSGWACCEELEERRETHALLEVPVAGCGVMEGGVRDDYAVGLRAAQVTEGRWPGRHWVEVKSSSTSVRWRCLCETGLGKPSWIWTCSGGARWSPKCQMLCPGQREAPQDRSYLAVRTYWKAESSPLV